MHDADAGEHPGSTLSLTSMKTHPCPTVIAASAAVLVGLSACADSDAEPATEALAAEDVLTEVPDVTVDPSGTFATLSATTDLEMACAVVYGQTEDLGEGIATDDDMGGAHTTHQAVMRDLEPDAVYHYHLQGSGSDGRLYQGELATFRPPRPVPQTRPVPTPLSTHGSRMSAQSSRRPSRRATPSTVTPARSGPPTVTAITLPSPWTSVRRRTSSGSNTAAAP